jgi:hypothetical protein
LYSPTLLDALIHSDFGTQAVFGFLLVWTVLDVWFFDGFGFPDRFMEHIMSKLSLEIEWLKTFLISKLN